MGTREEGAELKTCPCCGSEGAFQEVEEEGESQGAQYVECTNKGCGISTPLRFPLMDSVDDLLAGIWNRRPLRKRQRGGTCEKE